MLSTLRLEDHLVNPGEWIHCVDPASVLINRQSSMATMRKMRFAITFLSGAALLLLAVPFAQNAALTQRALTAKLIAQREVLYLPSGKQLQLISFGYRNMLSNILWFKTISYFGKHYGSDRNYEWLYHMCTLVSSLNPKTPHVYKFCSMMLAWEANQPEKSHHILTRAIENFPESWEFRYYRGILNYLFLSNEEQSRDDLTEAANLPNAPLIVRRLAAKKLAVSNPNTAIEFLKSMIEKSENDTERKALTQRLREAIYERDARTLERAVEIFERRTNSKIQSLTQLVESGLVEHLKDPYGGNYILDETTGAVVSSKGRARFQVHKHKSGEQLRKRWENVGGHSTDH